MSDNQDAREQGATAKSAIDEQICQLQEKVLVSESKYTMCTLVQKGESLRSYIMLVRFAYA